MGSQFEHGEKNSFSLACNFHWICKICKVYPLNVHLNHCILHCFQQQLKKVYNFSKNTIFADPILGTCTGGQECVWGGWFLAGNQDNHQNFVPSLISKNFWLIFMEIKQKKNFLKNKIQNGRLKKKTHFPAPPILNIFSWNFHGLVLGLVELVDAKGIGMA